MQKLNVILLSSVVLVLAGCGKQGSSSDPYNSESGNNSNTDYNRRSVTNDYQGGLSGRSDASVINNTNYPGWESNTQSLRIDPQRTNGVPEY